MSGEDSKQTNGNQQSFMENDAETSNAKNAASLKKDSFAVYSKDINLDKQGKHLLGSSNYQPGKSLVTINIDKLQKLVHNKSGKGEPVSSNKERVDFGEVIGIYYDPVNHTATSTTVGIIHYSKNGAHVVPARPKKKR